MRESFLHYDFTLVDELNSSINWEDYYEAANNVYMNDFVGLYISYYIFNSLEFILIGVLLFFGSIICICLFRLTKVVKFKNYNSFLKLFKISQNFLFNSFMRRQNIVSQANEKASIRSFSGKNIKTEKKNGSKK